MKKLTPLKQKIVDALLSEGGRQLNYHYLASKLWPPDKHPKAWNYSSNGGPHGWSLAYGRALRELREEGIAKELLPKYETGRGDVVLIVPPND